MVEFGCGARSVRSVLKPLLATAAERLMAVVVFPTPPFWLATVMIIEPERILTRKRRPKAAQTDRGDQPREASAASARDAAAKGRRASHLVFPHVVRIEVVEPLLHLLVLIVGVGRNGLGLVEHRLRHVD